MTKPTGSKPQNATGIDFHHGLLAQARTSLALAQKDRDDLDRRRTAETHPSDELRDELRQLGREQETLKEAVVEVHESIDESKALRAELITAKTKAERAGQAGNVLEGAHYQRCPECGTNLSDRPVEIEACRLCGTDHEGREVLDSLEFEVLRRDFNERIDQLADSINRQERESDRMLRQLTFLQHRKERLDGRLMEELERYDSAYLESVRDVERKVATLNERIIFLKRLQQMPQAVAELEVEAGALQGQIDHVRTLLEKERGRLSIADKKIAAIANEFKRIMLAVSFPGVQEDDEVEIDPRNWRPVITHGDIEWGFWDTGSGGKKTLFNVCYALAIHVVALERDMPVPNVLIIDSPTKNISEDEDPELVHALYDEIYRIASDGAGGRLQFLLIDSDLVSPKSSLVSFSERRMAGEEGAPSLIPYYEGP